MSLETIASHMCEDLIHEIGRRGDRAFIVTTFTYPDGDFVPLYLDQFEGKAILTDHGTTLFKCAEDGLDMQVESRRDLIHAVCASAGVDFTENAMWRPVHMDKPAPDVIALLSAITRVSNFQYDRGTKARPYFDRQVGLVLQAKVKPLRGVERKYVYADIDAKGAFPVDFKIGGPAQARHIFTIQSPAKSNVVVATTQFLKANNHGAPTMAIVGPDTKLSAKEIERLRLVTSKVLHEGPQGHEEEIVDFALATAA